MNSRYQYSYDSHISYPMKHKNVTKVSLGRSNMLFGDALRQLCQETETNLGRLKGQLMNPGDRPTRYTFQQEQGNRAESSVLRPCEMCSSLTEHQQHIARRGERLKAKEKIKARVVFIAPPPVVKKKPVLVTDRKEILYRVSVKTGTQTDAATSAKVFITLHGEKESTQKKELSKRLSANFSFGRGTREVFYIKGPTLGELRGITIEHNGHEKRHGWFLEEVEIVNMTSGQTWVCVCADWLSLYKGYSLAIRKDIKAEQRAVKEREYDVRVITANHRTAGTDANVFITFYGSGGVSKKLTLKNKSNKSFERGEEDNFVVKINHIGKLSKIRIEHDNSGSDPSWLLEKVVIENADNVAKTMFPCGEWLSVDHGDGETFKDLYPADKVKKRSKQVDKRSVSKGDCSLLDYEVTVLTGSVSYAGTDANVYLQMTGVDGRAREVQLRNNASDNFEKGQTDIFQVRAEDVGKLRKIYVRHDNAGLAPGWFLEKMVIRRFFSRTEIVDRLQQMQTELDSARTETDPITSDRRHTDTLRHKLTSRRGESPHFSPGDKLWHPNGRGDSEPDAGRTFQRKHNGHDSDSSVESEQLFRKWQKDRLPFCDEYTFMCKRWLAEDEGDGLISREIKPTSVTTFFKKSK